MMATRSPGLHTPLWYVLVAGKVNTVLHSLFFGTKVVWLQALSIAVLTPVIVLVPAESYRLMAPLAGSMLVE